MSKIRKTKILPPLLLAALALSMAACNKESIISHSVEDYNISSQNQERETSTTDTIPIYPSSSVRIESQGSPLDSKTLIVY